MRSLPRLLLAACACLGVVVLLVALGIGLDLLPEEFDIEWNGLPLSEYDLGDLAGGIILFGLVGTLLAGIHLGRTRGGSTPPRERRLAVVVVVAGLVPLAVAVLIIAMIIAVCSSGACS